MDNLSNTSSRSDINIPIWEKHNLSINEACALFNIGKNCLYKICKENPDADFILRIGNRILIKSNLFKKYIDKQSELPN